MQNKKEWEKEEVERFLGLIADDLEPKSHCCECTPGEHYQPHVVHIQYFNCTCNPNDYVLRRND